MRFGEINARVFKAEKVAAPGREFGPAMRMVSPGKWSSLYYAMRCYAQNFVRNLIMQSMSEMQRDEPQVLDLITPDVPQGQYFEQARQGTRIP